MWSQSYNLSHSQSWIHRNLPFATKHSLPNSCYLNGIYFYCCYRNKMFALFLLSRHMSSHEQHTSSFLAWIPRQCSVHLFGHCSPLHPIEGIFRFKACHLHVLFDSIQPPFLRTTTGSISSRVISEGCFCHGVLVASSNVSVPLTVCFSHFVCNCCHSHPFSYMITLGMVKPCNTHGPMQHFHLHYMEDLLVLCRSWPTLWAGKSHRTYDGRSYIKGG